MIRTTIDKVFIKRTIRPLYGPTQATPKGGVFVRAEGDPAIFPGMAVAHFGGDQYGAITGDSDVPAGLSALYVGGDDIDEPRDSGIDAFAVWVLGPDAEFEILAPAFDTEASWTEPDGGEVLVFPADGDGALPAGTLVPAGHAQAGNEPVARLIGVESETKIVVGGLLTRQNT